jgi:plastocyanin
MLASALLALHACRQPPEARLQPDPLLQVELGLTATDRVQSVRITGGEVERAEPHLIAVEAGAYVQFISTDWLIHEVIFEVDSLSVEQREFLERTHQLASPPLIERDSRYVLAFEGAPPGRYPYRLEGNGRSGGGEIVVAVPGAE